MKRTELKYIITKYMVVISVITLVILLTFSVVIQVLNERYNALEDARDMFNQIEQILAENRTELTEVTEEYSQTCLRLADTVSYILKDNPDAVTSPAELRKIAYLVGVDEIHIFNDRGEIIHGTNPEYFGFTFDSGEQMKFFKPILEDRSLRLVQDVTPNTAESKLMQYSMIWSETGEYIVQVGMEPTHIMEYTEKNELDYIFSLIQPNAGIDLITCTLDRGMIVGATDRHYVGKTLASMGVDINEAKNDNNGFVCRVNDNYCFCVFSVIDENLVGYIITIGVLDARVPVNTIIMMTGYILVVVFLMILVSRLIDSYVIKNVDRINESLRAVSEGEVDERIDVRDSDEFSELSDHINDMIKNLLRNTSQISEILNHTDSLMGVYISSSHHRRVRYTEHVPMLIGAPENAGSGKMDKKTFAEYLDTLKKHPVPGEDSTYEIDDFGRTIYVHVDETRDEDEVTGILIDVSDVVKRRRQIEKERDIDPMTGIFNRRGMDNAIAKLFVGEEDMAHCAAIMVDADGLKQINDNYGHDDGDLYLKSIVDLLGEFGSKMCRNYQICRMGGDEFALFIYGYGSESELMESIDGLADYQDNRELTLLDGDKIFIRFSYGYCIKSEEFDNYTDMLKKADEMMYDNKRGRKGKD